MKSNNLYNRIYDNSFSLLLTFSFYVLFFALLLSCEDEETLSDSLKEGAPITEQVEYLPAQGYQPLKRNQDTSGKKVDNKVSILGKITPVDITVYQQPERVSKYNEQSQNQ